MVGETSHVVVPHAATVAYAMQKDDRWRSGCSRLAYVERTGPGPICRLQEDRFAAHGSFQDSTYRYR